MSTAAYKVSWINRESEFEAHLKKLYEFRNLADTLLYCEGQVLRAHKFVLDFGSTHFRHMLQTGSSFWQGKDQLVFYMHNVRMQTLQSVLQFMYTGEVSVPTDRFQNFMTLCKSLGVKGMSNVVQNEPEVRSPSVSSWTEPETPPPAFIPLVEMAEEDNSHIEEYKDHDAGSRLNENGNIIFGDPDEDPLKGAEEHTMNMPEAMVSCDSVEEHSQASSSVADTSFGVPVKTEYSEEDSASCPMIDTEDPFRDVAYNSDASIHSTRSLSVSESEPGGSEPSKVPKQSTSISDTFQADISPRKRPLPRQIAIRKSKYGRQSAKPSTSKNQTSPKTPEANRIDINNPIAVFCQDCGQRITGRPELHMAQYHKGHPGSLRHECTLCQETFKQHFTAISHFRFVHNQQRTKYKCSNCGAEFVEVTTAARHKQHCPPVPVLTEKK